MVVIDASVLVNALVSDGTAGARANELLAEKDTWAAPEHMPMEVFSAVRGLCLGGGITEGRAHAALTELSEGLEIDLVGVRRLSSMMWELRGHVSGYDAAYAAAARLLDCPLVTADIRLAKAVEKHCQVMTV
ncbi:type II toxin-antitoxin system VapC family toxin [Nocardiopsis halotolerans]|uniref:type II toxin-antitoxin system VapC family toxin n=1 Tax=Nocardiopsis halotolerans TaxID=124252 RepID=UPI0003495095|nr:type II toxin-antitoxin system VapC family toxin [Nocardiopsis halotolerans]